MIWILYGGLSILEFLNCFNFYKCYLEVGKKLNKYFFHTIWLMLFVTSAAANAFLVNSNLDLYVAIFITIILGLLFKGSTSKKVIYGVIYILFSMAIELLISIIFGEIFARKSLAIEKYNFIIYVNLIFAQWLKYAIIFYIDKNKKHKVILSRSKNYIHLVIFPALSIILLIVYVNNQLDEDNLNYLFSYFLVSVLCLMNIFQYYMFEKVESLYIEKLQNDSMIQCFKYRESYYKEIEKHQQEIRALRHNIKNQLIAIKGYIDGKELEKADSEIELIICDILDLEHNCYTKNMALNSILNAKYSEIKQKNIEGSFDISIPEEVNLSCSDIGNLVGNILDNAIEACEKCQDNRFIRLIIYYYKHSLVLYCINSTNGENKMLRTTKENHEQHGLGIKSIEKIVKKYYGGMTVDFIDNTCEVEINLWNM